MFDELTRKEIASAAGNLGIELAALLAVAEIESGGNAFALIDGRREPIIRFEGHYFDRRLTGAAQARARKEGLSNPRAGAVANPRTQAARWALLRKAARIDHRAAHESVSWGVGQVMGAHWKWLGYASVDSLVAEARHSVAGQIRLMTQYIDKAGLTDALRRRDWAGFARGYNGPDYARHGYHTRIGDAYLRHAGTSAGHSPTKKDTSAGRVLARGMSGPDVLDLQTALVAAGYPVRRDAIFGFETESALRRFQADNGLAADGLAGRRTKSALSRSTVDWSVWHAIKEWFSSVWKSRN